MKNNSLREKLDNNKIILVPGIYDSFGALMAEKAGFEALYNIDANLPISIGFFGRTNIINSTKYDILSWITLGANLGIDIP